MSHELGVYWHRKGNSSDNAAHQVEEELKESAGNPAQAHDKLLEAMLVVSGMTRSTQAEFLRNLKEDDPAALGKLRKIVPEMQINDAHGPSDYYFFGDGGEHAPIEVNAKLTPEQKMANAIAADLAETGFCPHGGDMHKLVKGTILDKGKQSEEAALINAALASVGDSDPTDKVSVAPSSKAGQPQDIVLKDEKGRIRASL